MHFLEKKRRIYEIKLIPNTKLNQIGMTVFVGDLFYVMRIEIVDF